MFQLPSYFSVECKNNSWICIAAKIPTAWRFGLTGPSNGSKHNGKQFLHSKRAEMGNKAHCADVKVTEMGWRTDQQDGILWINRDTELEMGRMHRAFRRVQNVQGEGGAILKHTAVFVQLIKNHSSEIAICLHSNCSSPESECSLLVFLYVSCVVVIPSSTWT